MISDRVPNCLLDAMARQDWFKIKVNSDWMAQRLGTHKFPITMSLFADAYPVLAQLYKTTQELDVDVSLVNPRVIFGTNDENVRLFADLQYGLKTNGSMNYILYDELHLTSAVNFEISQEVLFANVNSLVVTPTKSSRTEPIFTNFQMTTD